MVAYHESKPLLNSSLSMNPSWLMSISIKKSKICSTQLVQSPRGPADAPNLFVTETEVGESGGKLEGSELAVLTGYAETE